MTADSGHGTNMSDADYREHLKTWNGFLQLCKWIVIGNVILFVFLFFFRTHN